MPSESSVPADLLTSALSRHAEEREVQATARADFLSGVSRAISGMQRPERAMEAAVDLLTSQVVEFAQLYLPAGSTAVVRGQVRGHPLRARSTPRVAVSLKHLERTMEIGAPEQVLLPRDRPRGRSALSRLVLDPRLLEDVTDLAPDRLLQLPLVARGQTLGLLSLARASGLGIDTIALEFLGDLADRLALTLDATRVLATSRQVAEVLRHSLEPRSMPHYEGLAFGSLVQVARDSEDVGGDFYDVHGDADDVTLVLGDVAGKGIEASVSAMRLRVAARTAAEVDRSPERILQLVNSMLAHAAHENAHDELFATAMCVRVQRPPATTSAGSDGSAGSGHEVTLAGAGHPDALVVRTSGVVERLASGGLALGLAEDSTYPVVRTVLGHGDALVLYTDGVTAARGHGGTFGQALLESGLAESAGMSVDVMVNIVATALSDHLEGRPHDDIALVAVQPVPPSGPEEHE